MYHYIIIIFIVAIFFRKKIAGEKLNWHNSGNSNFPIKSLKNLVLRLSLYLKNECKLEENCKTENIDKMIR